MTRFTASLIACFTLLLLVVNAEENEEIPKITTPMSQLLIQDEVHTAIRTKQTKTPSKFYGHNMGRFITDTDSGYYRGRFYGRSTGKKTNAMFKYSFHGRSSIPGFTTNYRGNLNGDMRVHGLNANIGANFDMTFTGMMGPKPIKGRVNGNMRVRSWYRDFSITERGRFDVMVGVKRMTGNYKAFFDKSVLKVDMRGLYGGKPFFIRYEFSPNVLDVIFGGKNPMMIRRNYGTVVVYVNGKKYIKKYDLKGFKLPNSSNFVN